MKFITLFLVIIFANIVRADKQDYAVLDLEFKNNIPFIKLNIDGHNVDLLFDTGARNAEIILDKAIIAKLNGLLEFERKTKSSDVTGKEYIAKKYIIPQIQIGNLTFLKLKLDEDTKWGLNIGSKLEKDGAIGLAFFRDKSIIIDYSSKKLVIIEKNIPLDYKLSEWANIPYKINQYGINISLQLGEKKEKKQFMLDTGANFSVIKPSSIGESEVIDNCFKMSEMLCKKISPPKFFLGDFKINTFDLFIFEIQKMMLDGILGYEFFADKQIYIDFEKREMKINFISKKE